MCQLPEVTIPRVIGSPNVKPPSPITIRPMGLVLCFSDGPNYHEVPAERFRQRRFVN